MNKPVIPRLDCESQGNKNKGFTLIEVLIALAILAIALVALIKVSGQSVSFTLHAKEKIAAHFVAMNVMAEAQVGMIKLEKDGEQEGVSNMLGNLWCWKIIQEKIDNAGFQKIKILVGLHNLNNKRERLVGFVRKNEK